MASGADQSRPTESLDQTERMAPTIGPPPAYDGNQEVVGSFQPPAYDVATKLPTYAEAEKSKAEEAGVLPALDPECPDRARRQARRQRAFLLWDRSSSSDSNPGPGLLLTEREPIDPSTMSHVQLQQQVLGTELEFLCCFLIAFLFNWIGLFASLCCLTATISGRAGAISGFGLSVVKWAFLVMHQSYITRETLGFTTESTIGTSGSPFLDTDRIDQDLHDNKWFTVSCWLIVGLGFLCFLQGIFQYARARRCARDYNWLRQRYQGQAF